MKSFLWLLPCTLLPWMAPVLSADNESLSRQYLNRGFDLMDRNADSSHYYFSQAMAQAQQEQNDDNLYRAVLGKIDLLHTIGQLDSLNFYQEWLFTRAFSNNASPKTRAMILYRLSHELGIKSEFFDALKMLDTAAVLALQINDSLYYADVINRRGVINENMGRRSAALECYLEALNIYEQHNDPNMAGATINNIAVSYKKAGDLKNAMRYYNKAIEAATDESSKAIGRVNRGLLFKDLKKIPDALSDLHFALQVFERTDYTYGIAACHHNLAEVHLAAGNTDSSLYYLNRSQDAAEKLEYTALVIKNNLALAKLYRRKADYAVSTVYAQRALAIAEAGHSLEDLNDIHRMLSDNYNDLGDYQKALVHYQAFKLAEDTLKNKESEFKLNIMRTEYDLQQKEREIESLTAMNEYQTRLAEERRRLNTILTASFTALAICLVILFILYRRQQSLSRKLTGQKALLIEQKEEITATQEQIVQQNEALVKINQEKDNLIAIVAHDLRSPLNQIRAVLGLIKMENEKHSSLELIELANQSSEILSERVNKILDIEAINAGKVNVKTTKLEVAKVLDNLKQNVHSAAIQKRMNLKVDTSRELSCLADQNYLLQVLENLCTNAIKYSPENSEIFVSATGQDKNVLFAVKDQGPGIPETERANLFLPYSKTSNKPTGNESSTGLGLAIVKKYVEAMAGEVWVESEPNKGSVFYVKLPKAA